MEYFHSVTLDEEKCKGCTSCIKSCPTEAIRVRKSKARIINERCIDCGECIRVCPHHAKKAISDSVDLLKNYKYKIALPAPTLYGQFKNAISRNHILTALKNVGFDMVFEVAKGAEFVTNITKKYLKKNDIETPVISSACPAVVRLIQTRFPGLIENLLPVDSPMEISAELAKEYYARNFGVKKSEIGAFFISPCAAKVTAVKSPYGKAISSVDGVISIKDLYLQIINNISNINLITQLSSAGSNGIIWAGSGGESMGLKNENFLAVDGINNCLKIFEEVENGHLKDVEFIEALSCSGGCLGGPIAVENVYVAKARLKKFIDEAKKNKHIKFDQFENEILNIESKIDHFWKQELTYRTIMMLDSDISVAMQMIEDQNKIALNLPGLDCGACGAPTCLALAEDIVRNKADETYCVFKLREKVRDLALQMMQLEAKMPPVLDKND